MPLPGGELPAGRKFPLSGEDVLIGRAADASLRLTGNSVAVRHAALVGENGAFWLKDMGSHTGVRLNGRRQEQTTALRDGDVLQIGDQSFRFRQERKRGWEPNIWTLFLLLCAGGLFFYIQCAAWSVAGPKRPEWNTFAGWAGGLAAEHAWPPGSCGGGGW